MFTHLKSCRLCQQNTRRYVERNRFRILILRRNWEQRNKAKLRAKDALINARKLRAVPKWLTKDMIREIRNMYIRAADLSAELSVMHHVDHIIPLLNPTVCGLHVPWNLQILTATQNLKKGNKL